MSATVAVIAASSAASSAVTAARIAAKKAECRAFLPVYKNDGDIGSAKAYAECVQLLYPDPANPAVMKPVVGFLLLALVAAAVISFFWKDDFMWEGVIGRTMLAGAVWIGIVFSAGAVALIVAGVGYLLS